MSWFGWGSAPAKRPEEVEGFDPHADTTVIDRLQDKAGNMIKSLLESVDSNEGWTEDNTHSIEGVEIHKKKFN